MPSSIIHRYLLREILGPTLLCLLVFTMVLLAGRMVRLVELVINKGVALADIALLFSALLPPFLAIALPLAFLMGIMLGLGRLCADGETTALKAAGIGLDRIARPVLAMACVCALLTGLIAWWGAPWGNRTFRGTLFEITSKKASVALQPQLFIKQFGGLVLYADGLDERTGEMRGVFIVEQKRADEPPLLIVAESGRVFSDPVEETVTLRLRDGTLHRQAAAGRGDGYQVARFARYDVRPDLAPALAEARKPNRKPKELTFAELRRRAAEDGRPALAARAELHRRLCAPLAPLLFVLFALPFGIRSQRSGRGGGFLAGLAIYLAYYALTSLAETLTADAGLHPLLTFWAVHGALFAAGLLLLRQAARERTSRLVELFDGAVLKLQRLRRRDAHP